MTKQKHDLEKSWVDKIIKGEVGLHRLPDDWSEYDRARTRLRAVTEWSRKPELTERIKKNGVVGAASGKNCEQIVGELTVPLGVAGPLRLMGLEDVWVPLATTEGALVASIQRGMKVLKKAETWEVEVEDTGTSRAPVFVVAGLKEGKRIEREIQKRFKEIQEIAAKTSNHIKLKEIKTTLVGRNLWLKLAYDTGEAMGMNMVTIATEKVVEWAEIEWGIKGVALSGNKCVDKKPAWENFINGRGLKVQAEVKISRELVEQNLKTSPEQIIEVVMRKDWLGSMASGSMGFNGHYANMIAALFLATGQDLAHVVEGSLGITTAEMVGDELYFSVYLPDLMVGTVGGGTRLPVQKACLELMGLSLGEEGEKERLAKIIGGTVLAGELSLTAALAAGHLARAHQRLGRSKV